MKDNGNEEDDGSDHKENIVVKNKRFHVVLKVGCHNKFLYGDLVQSELLEDGKTALPRAAVFSWYRGNRAYIRKVELLHV